MLRFVLTNCWHLTKFSVDAKFNKFVASYSSYLSSFLIHCYFYLKEHSYDPLFLLSQEMSLNREIVTVSRQYIKIICLYVRIKRLYEWCGSFKGIFSPVVWSFALRMNNIVSFVIVQVFEFANYSEVFYNI